MARSTRIAILIGTLLILVAGTALRHPGVAAGRHAAAEPGAGDAGRVPKIWVTRSIGSRPAGIEATSDQLQSLSADYGLGGAVRLLAWADATGMSLADLRAMRDDGAGWGQMAHDLGVSPGIGWIMGQGAGAAGEHGREGAPGQQKPKPDGAHEDEAGESPGD